MSIKNRFKLLIAQLKNEGVIKTQKELGFNLGFETESAFSQVVNEKVPISESLYERIESLYGSINVEWLKTGKGEMLKSSNEDYMNKEELIENMPNVISNADISTYLGVPYYDIAFSGGWNSDEIFSHAKPSFFITSPDFKRAEFATNLVGHSISKVIPDGAAIGLRQIDDWKTYFPTNELYGVITKNELRTVKRVKRKKGDPNTLVLVPDPSDEHTGYEPEEIPVEFVSKMFQVVAWALFKKVAM